MKRYWISVQLLFVLMPALTRAGDLSSLYNPSVLTREQERLASRITQISAVFWDNFTSAEKQALRQVNLNFPVVDQQLQQDPFAYYADTFNQTITLSILSLKFFEDLCTAYAWLWANQYNLDTIDEYVNMLKYKPAANFSGGRYPPPLTALHIPANALTDGGVEDISLRFRNSAFAFILAHELGHVYHRHQTGDPAQTQKNEAEADRFALKIMQRTSTIPLGIILYFQATAYYTPHRGDFQNDRQWEYFLKTTASHPLSAQRIEAIADQIQAAPERFLSVEPDQRAGQELILFIADGLKDEIASTLEDPDLQQCMAAIAIHADPSSLTPRRPGDETGARLIEQWCSSDR